MSAGDCGPRNEMSNDEIITCSRHHAVLTDIQRIRDKYRFKLRERPDIRTDAEISTSGTLAIIRMGWYKLAD
jgi:hypothetical protein